MAKMCDFLMGKQPVSETLDWFDSTLFPAVQERLTDPKIRGRLGLYGGELIPTNERNLTDTRNRVSLIYEYLLADAITELLAEEEADAFCAYVVANRFPDLEIRDSNGERGLRIEVKCLQATAEEKAANFSTLIKDLHPCNDFLVVFIWEWGYDVSNVKWDRAPIVGNIIAFHARSLAILRDWYWLNRPPSNLGQAFQGYDMRTAVTAVNGVYKEEEGNYGKLLRIWDKDFSLKPVLDEIQLRTEVDYNHFRYLALHSGFEALSILLRKAGGGNVEFEVIQHNEAVVGFKNGTRWFVLNSQIDTGALTALMVESGVTDVIRFNDKYSWVHCTYRNGALVPQTTPEKPKKLYDYLANLPISHLGGDLPLFGSV